MERYATVARRPRAPTSVQRCMVRRVAFLWTDRCVRGSRVGHAIDRALSFPCFVPIMSQNRAKIRLYDLCHSLTPLTSGLERAVKLIGMKVERGVGK